ncbi:MAG: hypothetical protein H0T51_19240 [Pirellulales bacterium]|nr:hypothetical protein [Pirellulales bacterium]
MRARAKRLAANHSNSPPPNTPASSPATNTPPKNSKKRTLTNLYNQRPAWLDSIHRQLDENVFAAFGWSPTMTDDELLAALLELNLHRAAESPQH